jgi:NADPH2:quinone reductase
VDVDVAANLEIDAAVLEPGGVIASYFVAADPVVLPPLLMARNAEVRFVLVYTMPDEAKRRAAEDITAALRDGALTALPGLRFGLEDIAAAHDAVENGAMGKVLVDIPHDDA